MSPKTTSNKSFGITFSIVFLIISIWSFFNNANIEIWALVFSIIFLILGIFNSNLLTPLNKVWFKFGLILGNIISPIVMGVVFFLVVTPIGICLKLFSKDVLSIKKNNLTTYWKEKSKYDSSMKNQF